MRRAVPHRHKAQCGKEFSSVARTHAQRHNARARTHRHTHTRARTHTRTRTHTHTHTHTQSYAQRHTHRTGWRAKHLWMLLYRVQARCFDRAPITQARTGHCSCSRCCRRRRPSRATIREEPQSVSQAPCRCRILRFACTRRCAGPYHRLRCGAAFRCCRSAELSVRGRAGAW